jgi:tRNA (guanine6-N2)-methyltransferase
MARRAPVRSGNRGPAAPSAGRGRPTRGHKPATPLTSRIEILFAAGLDESVKDEAFEKLGKLRSWKAVPGRSDSISFDYSGSWRPLLQLNTIIAPFAVLSFAVPRPKSLVSGDHLARIARTLRAVQQTNRERPPASFRFDAAGRNSPAFQRLASELEAATGLVHDPEDGDALLRFRPFVHTTTGWEVLVRLSTRPLSYRPWRVRNYPGAADAPISRAIARLTKPKPTDRVANLMCGSGTMLIERLLEAPARCAVGIDSNPEVLEACAENLRAAGLRSAVQLMAEDVRDTAWQAKGPFDVLLADPPWGTLVGDHATNESLHLALLESAHRAAAPGARLVVLTHEIRHMEQCLRRTRHLWTPVSETRVFQKGHHPRIFLLRAAPGSPLTS